MKFNKSITSNLSNTLLKLTLFFGITTFPLYLLPSGSVQITHILLLMFSFLVLVKIGFPRDKYFYIFLSFLIYCFLTNIFYSFYDYFIVRDSTFKHYIELIFLTYNFLLTTSLISYFKNQKKNNFFVYAIVCGILIIVFHLSYLFLFGKFSFRYHGLFNNPNQLGYFSVCCFSLIYIFYRKSYISYFNTIFLLVLLICLSILTLSKAAYISLFLCFLFALKPINFKFSKIIWLIFILAIIFFITLFFLEISETAFYNRMINLRNENDSSLEVRGYLVYFKANLLQAIFGMGPKNVYAINGVEIHSTFAMILTSYGFIGFSIFALLILLWIFDIKKSYGIYGVICVCGPTLLYGLTHNGIRFSIFYIFFVASLFMTDQINKEKYSKNL